MKNKSMFSLLITVEKKSGYVLVHSALVETENVYHLSDAVNDYLLVFRAEVLRRGEKILGISHTQVLA